MMNEQIDIDLDKIIAKKWEILSDYQKEYDVYISRKNRYHEIKNDYDVEKRKILVKLDTKMKGMQMEAKIESEIDKDMLNSMKSALANLERSDLVIKKLKAMSGELSDLIIAYTSKAKINREIGKEA